MQYAVCLHATAPEYTLCSRAAPGNTQSVACHDHWTVLRGFCHEHGTILAYLCRSCWSVPRRGRKPATACWSSTRAPGGAIGLHTNQANQGDTFDECRTGRDHLSVSVAGRP